MSYLQAIVLLCLHHLKGERTIYSVLHILNGKKSSQSIQDIHLFQLKPFFGTVPELYRDKYNEIIESLVKENLVTLDTDFFAKLTTNGEKKLTQYYEKHFKPKQLENVHFGSRVYTFWRRLSLIIQCLSNLTNKEKSFFPIQRNPDIQRWVKGFLREFPDSNKISIQLYNELFQLLDGQEEDPNILVLRLTGFQDVGLTDIQLAHQLEIDIYEYRFRFITFLHNLANGIVTNKTDFPILSRILDHSEIQSVFTLSTEKTYHLLKRGHTLQEISVLRNLKESTIEDHIVEIAIQDNNFSLVNFISNEEIENVDKVVKDIGSKKLKSIRIYLPNLTYFQIRLALAKLGDQN